jgi:hypothetical protein
LEVRQRPAWLAGRCFLSGLTHKFDIIHLKTQFSPEGMSADVSGHVLRTWTLDIFPSRQGATLRSPQQIRSMIAVPQILESDIWRVQKLAIAAAKLSTLARRAN